MLNSFKQLEVSWTKHTSLSFLGLWNLLKALKKLWLQLEWISSWEVKDKPHQKRDRSAFGLHGGRAHLGLAAEAGRTHTCFGHARRTHSEACPAHGTMHIHGGQEEPVQKCSTLCSCPYLLFFKVWHMSRSNPFSAKTYMAKGVEVSSAGPYLNMFQGFQTKLN